MRETEANARLRLLTLICLGLAAVPGFAGEATAAADGRPSYEIREASSAVKVDAVLDEEVWKTAAQILVAYEIRPGENIAARVETVCLVTYDRHHLYVAFRASDPRPSEIRARLTDRDAAFDDDFVGIMIDTFDDARRSYELFVNPLGVQMDLFSDDLGGGEDSSWDAIWESRGRITKEGYIVEAAIPFSSLRFPKTEGPQRWGFSAIRIYPRSKRFTLASEPRDRKRNCSLCQYSRISGIQGITPGRNLEIDPTITADASRSREDSSAPLESNGTRGDAGISLDWGPTPNLALNATINPDFSQVEADAAQLDINTRFALFFPEKRPFFLEGTDFFDTPLDAVFTRNVADPSFGLKLTGKHGRSAFGVFVARDEITNLIFPGSEGSSSASLDTQSTDAVARYRLDVGTNSVIGALATYRGGSGYENGVVGIDGNVRFTDTESLSWQYLLSRTSYPDELAAEMDQPEGNLTDDAFAVDYNHRSRSWRWGLEYEDIGEMFRADMGFMPQTGFRRERGYLRHIWYGESWFDEIASGISVSDKRDSDGAMLFRSAGVFTYYQGPLQSFVNLSANIGEESYEGITFDANSVNLYGNIRPNSHLQGGVWLHYGDAIDFGGARQGRERVIDPFVDLSLGRHLKLFADVSYRSFDLPQGELFHATLAQTTVIYQFNIRSFLRAILQYTDIRRNVDLYHDDVEAESRDLASQFLFSYKLNARTVLFLGYSDTRVGSDQIDLQETDQVLFLKLGYAFVL